MTTGTIHTFDAARRTGTVRCIAGTLVPFSARDDRFRAGDRVTFRLTGGITGLYADHVEPAAQLAPRRPRQTVIAPSVFLSKPSPMATLVG